MIPLPLDSILELAIRIQQIPAPTFAEGARADFLAAAFRKEGLVEVEIDNQGNTHGRMPGRGKASPLLVAAHMDTVFPAETALTIREEEDRIYGPGIGDNSLGMAGLVGLLWGLQARGIALPGDLILVGTVGEEGLGDSNGMQAVVDRYGDQVRASLVLEGMALGHIFNRGMGVRRYGISVRTKGGHSWVDYGTPSAIHELAQLVTRLAVMPVPEEPRTTLNVGMLSGGTSVNSIASQASLELDLRSEDSVTLLSLAEEVVRFSRACERPGVEVRVSLIGERPSGGIPPDHPLVALAERCLLNQGIEPRLSIGSTDASIPLHRGLPAICIGLTTGKGAHTEQEFIFKKPLEKGMEQLMELVVGLFQEPRG